MTKLKCNRCGSQTLAVALHTLALLTLLAVAQTAFGANGCPPPDTQIAVPQDLMATIGELLPERSNAGAAYVSDAYSPNVIVTEPATVDFVFLWEGAGYRNTLGYFLYREESDGSVEILDANLILPNASFPSAGCQQTGDLYTLRDADGNPRVFQPGDRIGFFVVADGWSREPRVRNWNPFEPTMPTADPQRNRGFGRGLYTSINKLNPEFAQGSAEMSRHLAMIRMPGHPGFLDGESFLLSGFEDLNRLSGSDDDFNDVVFVLQSSPITAIETTEAFPYEAGDPDGDGVTGIDDHFPNDPERATLVRYPSSGHSVVAFEDQYPSVGDADYNDCVVAYDFQLVKDATGRIKDVVGTFHLVARGAGYNHRLGVHIPGLPDGAKGTLRVERFLSGDTVELQTDDPIDIEDLVANRGRRISDLFPSTYHALPPISGSFTNTQSETPERAAASARFRLELQTPLRETTLGFVPYDLYFAVFQNGEEYDVHFPGMPAFDDRPAHLPIEEGDDSFLDENGFPWLVEIPTNWRFPLERVHVELGYPRFETWRSSRGKQRPDWYDFPTEEAGSVSSRLFEYVPARDWTVRLPDA